MRNYITCPITAEKADGTTIRIIASFVLVLAIAGFLLKSIPLFGFLAIDFSLRAFGYTKWSVLFVAASKFGSLLHLPKKPIIAAPKRFAASLGLVFNVSIIIALVFKLIVLVNVLSISLIFCAFLESTSNICLGCYVYTFLQTLKKIKI